MVSSTAALRHSTIFIDSDRVLKIEMHVCSLFIHNHSLVLLLFGYQVQNVWILDEAHFAQFVPPLSQQVLLSSSFRQLPSFHLLSESISQITVVG